MRDSIVAIATAPGQGSIAIVRLSGVDALQIAQKITQYHTFKPRYAHLLSLYADDNTTLDEAIVIYFKSPHSFTGEDVVEFQCHGGVIVARSVVSRVLDLGARLATAGEFTKRAYLLNRIDLSQAESIANLINAKSENAAKVLVRQLKGSLGNFVNSSKDQLLELLAYSEVNIDYAEEDLPLDIVAQMSKRLSTLQQHLQKTVQSSKRREGVMNGFKVSIIGKPNVGKSSLLNALLDYNRAIVSTVAGTTRDTIEEELYIKGYLVRIIDTAGIRDSSDEIESIGIQRSIESARESDIIIALFDASSPTDDNDKEIIEFLKSLDETITIKVLNKSDLAKQTDLDQNSNFLNISCKHNISALIDKLEQILDNQTCSDETMLVSLRQVSAMQKATDEIDLAQKQLEHGELELFSFHIHAAIEAMSSITKQFDNDEMLDKMFSNFCLGK